MNQSGTLNELKIAQQELILQHRELKKCARKLRIVNENLDTLEIENKKQTNKMNSDLEEMMFSVSHKVRKSVANILGISILLETDESLSADEWKEMLHILIQSSKSLNKSTEELSKFIYLKKNTYLKT